MENTRKSEAIKKVLDDMRRLTREELIDIIKSYSFVGECKVDRFSSRVCSRGTKSCVLQHMEDAPKYQLNQEVSVDFASGTAVVVIQSFHQAWDGEYIYHVRDKATGHEDFVGQQFIKQL